MKQFAVFDIDGTIFRWQLYHELFDALVDERIITPEAVSYTHLDVYKRQALDLALEVTCICLLYTSRCV